jgi:hypothetical protein
MVLDPELKDVRSFTYKFGTLTNIDKGGHWVFESFSDPEYLKLHMLFLNV